MKTFRKKIIIGIVFACSILAACDNNKKTNNTSINKDYLDESENAAADSTKLREEKEAENDKLQAAKDIEDDKITLKYAATAPEDYIDKCIFLGDSRIVGFGMTSYPRKGSWLADIGITHIGAMSMKYKTKEGTVYTLDSYLDSHQASVVYVCYGVNGINTTKEDQYKLQYDKLIDKIKEKEPKSKIVIVSILPVRDEGSYKNVLVSADVRKYNDFLYELAEKKDVFYLDLYEQIADKDGQMDEKYDAGDGLHFASKAYDDIYDYIIHHPVLDYETDGLNQYPKENMIWHTPVKKTVTPEASSDTPSSESDDNSNNVFENPTEYDFNNMENQILEGSSDILPENIENINPEIVDTEANDGENSGADMDEIIDTDDTSTDNNWDTTKNDNQENGDSENEDVNTNDNKNENIDGGSTEEKNNVDGSSGGIVPDEGASESNNINQNENQNENTPVIQ